MKWTCTHCGADLPGAADGHLPICPVCSTPAEAGDSSITAPASERRKLWLWFWLAFIGTPIATALSAAVIGPAVLVVLLGGVVVSANMLAKLFCREDSNIVIQTFLWSVGIFVVYAAIAFAGCVMMMKNLH